MSDATTDVIARAIDPGIWQQDQPIPTRHSTIYWHQRRQESVKSAQAVLQALDEAGLVVVPVEPTQEMIERCRRIKLPSGEKTTFADDEISALARAMITAYKGETRDG